MKALVLGAGAGWSTKDVENGVVDGLRAAGVDVGRYAFEHRLSSSADYLAWVYRRAKKQHQDAAKPTAGDVQMHALVDVLPRALAHSVDFVVVVSGMFVPSAFLDVMQRAGLPVALLLTKSPYDMAKESAWARFADMVWTNERTAVPVLMSVAPQVRYLPHAWREGVHDAAQSVSAPSHDVVFVGTGFQERIELLEAIDWTGIDLGLYGFWQHVKKSSPIYPFVREGVTDNSSAAALYRAAKVGLNLYRQTAGFGETGVRITGAESLNPRAYELAACGCFHLSDARAEVGKIFGDLVPTFTDAVSCEALIRQWVAADTVRKSMAAELPARVAGHTWTVRGRQMAADMVRALPSARERVLRRASAQWHQVRGAA